MFGRLQRKASQSVASGPARRASSPAPAIGSQAALRRVQAKLDVSRPDDPAEREADRVADQVMRMIAPGFGAGAESNPNVLSVQRGAQVVTNHRIVYRSCEKHDRRCHHGTPQEVFLVRFRPPGAGRLMARRAVSSSRALGMTSGASAYTMGQRPSSPREQSGLWPILLATKLSWARIGLRRVALRERG